MNVHRENAGALAQRVQQDYRIDAARERDRNAFSARRFP